MLKKDYSISIEREIKRITNDGDEADSGYPRAFGDETKNNFIKKIQKNNLLICSPSENSITKAYNKFEEIMNVVYVELHYIGEMILPINTNSNDLHMSLNIELKNCVENYSELINNFNKNVKLLKNIYGDCKISVQNKILRITNIKTNYHNKNGLTEDDLKFWIVFIYTCIENIANTTLELMEKMNKTCQEHGMKYEKNILEIEKDISVRINDENKLSNTEIIKLAKSYSEEGYNTRYCLQKYSKLASESIVIIKDAISQGVNYEVLNENKSIVEFENNGHKEFVIEGNKTNRDSYIFPIITDDKYIAKQIMKNAGVKVPDAILLEKDMDDDEIIEKVECYFDNKLVVKPRNTNYGIGITVFSEPATQEQILNAIKYAFQFDNNVLIENYVKGMEYRFLVIDGKCLSVAHRRIASVVGDGISTINELIDKKNKEPWHYLTATPLKKDEPVIEYLKLQNLNLNSIIEEGKRVFLRTNSNCSTGGESILYTDIMPQKFKNVAEQAAKAFNGKICGVDIIIDDLEKDDYAIIEINDNPGYSINEWPYEPVEGRGEKIGISILKMLKLI